jgi:AcrR family transcriptional regulator
MRVVAARGLRGFTYRAVAKEAGVTHGLVQHYFGTLEALLEEALTASFERDRSQSPPHQSRTVDELADNLPRYIDQTRTQQAFQFEVLIESLRRPELRPHMRHVYESYHEAMGERLRHAGLPDDPDLARLVFAALDGLVLQRLLFEEDGDIEPCLDWLRALLAGLSERGTRRARPQPPDSSTSTRGRPRP